jgi:hypothetical protein
VGGALDDCVDDGAADGVFVPGVAGEVGGRVMGVVAAGADSVVVPSVDVGEVVGGVVVGAVVGGVVGGAGEVAVGVVVRVGGREVWPPPPGFDACEVGEDAPGGDVMPPGTVGGG